jgi:excinuclease UvrABC ATPase subunit
MTKRTKAPFRISDVKRRLALLKKKEVRGGCAVCDGRGMCHDGWCGEHSVSSSCSSCQQSGRGLPTLELRLEHKRLRDALSWLEHREKALEELWRAERELNKLAKVVK